MCGFSFLCSTKNPLDPDPELLALLRRRGPDGIRIARREVKSQDPTQEVGHGTFHMTFSASVLALRGESIVSQPLVDDESGSILMWNGEAWKFGVEVVSGNDSELIFNRLLSCTGNSHGSKSHTRTKISNIKECLGQIEGPFAFLFYDAPSKRVFYGRDRLGRRSLLYRKNGDDELMISSVAHETFSGEWSEVEPTGIHVVELELGCLEKDKNSSDDRLGIATLPWPKVRTKGSSVSLVPFLFCSIIPPSS